MVNNKKISPSNLSMFCYQLSLIFKSGIPIVDGIDLIIKDITDSRLKVVALDIQNEITLGNNIYKAIEKYDFFPVYMINMIKISEKTGNLDEELEDLSNYYENIDKLNSRIISAVTYPILLLTIMSAVIFFLIIKVLPMFHEILISLGAEIPLISKVMINISLTMRNYAFILIMLIVVVIFLIIYFLKDKTKKIMIDKFIFRIPFVNNIYRKVISTRFSNAMVMMLKSGASFDDALDISRHSIDNSYVQNLIEKARLNIIGGENPVAELEKIDIFPLLFMKMLRIGNLTGELENSLTKISNIYDKEVEKSLSKITSLIEPILVSILSIIIGIMLFTVMLPLINIISSIS